MPTSIATTISIKCRANDSLRIDALRWPLGDAGSCSGPAWGDSAPARLAASFEVPWSSFIIHLNRDPLARRIGTEAPRRHNEIYATGLRRPIASMRLKPSSYLILGMLNRGHQTGYAIKRTVDLSTRFFWAASVAQVYPELAALEQDDYVVSADDPHGARARKTYRLTQKGERALAEWLRSERVPDYEFRDEGLLRVFFADSIRLEDALQLITRLRVRAEQIERTFRDEILPLAEGAAGRFPLIAAREGADYYTWRAAWFRQIEAEISSQLDARGS